MGTMTYRGWLVTQTNDRWLGDSREGITVHAATLALLMDEIDKVIDGWTQFWRQSFGR